MMRNLLQETESFLAQERGRLEHCDKQAMRTWLSHLAPEIPVALEATFGWPWVADLLEELGHPVHLGHPPVIRALAKHEAKTDRCDSDRLGKFQLRGILPESYLAPPEVRQRRERRVVVPTPLVGVGHDQPVVGIAFFDQLGHGFKRIFQAGDWPMKSPVIDGGYHHLRGSAEKSRQTKLFACHKSSLDLREVSS